MPIFWQKISYTVNKKSYFYQVVHMEMLVTGIQCCDFYVWINSDNLQMIIEIINKT